MLAQRRNLALSLAACLVLATLTACSDDEAGSGPSDDIGPDVVADADDDVDDVVDEPDTPTPDVADDLDVAPDESEPDQGEDVADQGDTQVDAGPVEALAPLPEADEAAVAHFETPERCATCHSANDPVMVDSSGRDVSQSGLWPSSLMAQAMRDPYQLAVFSVDLEAHPAAADLINATCTRCHAPAASAALGLSEAILTFEDVASATDDAAHLGRDGVTCNACHQITDEGLGTEGSLTGGFVMSETAVSYGPHADPVAMQMTNVSGYPPVEGDHVLEAAFCATCHTVLTRSLDASGAPTGPVFPEQVPYLEWRNSVFNDEVASPAPEAASCVACHMPSTDRDGVALEGAIATFPMNLDPRSPLGRHDFVGGNVYMLELMANQTDWSGTDTSPAELSAAAEATRESLRSAADLEVELDVTADSVTASVRVINRTGHKFPTAYPTRRAWLRVALVDDDGEVLWASGRWNELGEIVDAAGTRLDPMPTVLPHRDVVAAEDQVQVFESVMINGDGETTHVLFDGAGYAKDNRLLPLGWSPTHDDAALAMPVGVDDDDDFGVAADDTVTYEIPRLEDADAVEVDLVFQSVPPYAVDLVVEHETPATVLFAEMVAAQPPVPEVVATQRVELE